MFQQLDITSIPGLTEAEAARRLKEEGYNELPSARKRSIFAIAFEVIREPMLLLLVAAGTIYIIFGDIQEGLILLSFVFVIIGITMYQERKTERTLEALRHLSSPRALVIRDRAQKRIAGREVVRGDTLVLVEGDRVPADAILLSCINLSVEESLLTGESVSVRKVVDGKTAAMCRPGGDDLPCVYSGTMVVRGQGIARVEATGIHTEMGKIGKAIQAVKPEETSLHRETGLLVRNLALVGLFLCVVVIIAYGLTRDDWLNGFLAGITLAMAILPEEFPVVLTIFLALGAWRISQSRVLTRRMPAIENLGSATVLCVDKTGTLTLNRMSISQIFARGKSCDTNGQKQAPPEIFHEIVEFGILAGQRDPFDPMEKALKDLGDTYLAHTEHIHRDWTLMREYPLSQKLLALSHVWKSPDGEDYVIAAKGAPEAIADLCHFSNNEMETLSRQVSTMANDGLRVIGVARAQFKQRDLPREQHDFKFELLGLLGFTDPVRETVPDAIKDCYRAGMRVVMITGDYPGTAQYIARQIGLKPADEVITGADMDKMDDAELQRRVKTVSIFARVVPEQKLRLVNALKANGETVAMTGDGVNDAPALKSANIGIAMGGRGTDVAREASALVLLDDDFSSIVKAVKLGRRIYDNLKKAMAYIFAIHVPIAGLSLIPVLFKWPLVLMPVHVVFLELIIDPASSVVFEAEPEEPDVMERPPRRRSERLFGRRTMMVSLLQGFIVLLITLLVYLVSLYRGQGELEARTLTFTTLVIANLGLILTNRSWLRTILATVSSRTRALWIIVLSTLVFLGLVLYVPFLRDLFHFGFLHPVDILMCLGAGVISVMWFEAFKLVYGRKARRGNL